MCLSRNIFCFIFDKIKASGNTWRDAWLFQIIISLRSCGLRDKSYRNFYKWWCAHAGVKRVVFGWVGGNGWVSARMSSRLKKLSTLYQDTCRLMKLSTETSRYPVHIAFLSGSPPNTVINLRSCLLHKFG